MSYIMFHILLFLTQGDFTGLTRAPSWLFNVIMLLRVAWWERSSSPTPPIRHELIESLAKLKKISHVRNGNDLSCLLNQNGFQKHEASPVDSG